jgi:hypothetical protein
MIDHTTALTGDPIRRNTNPIRQRWALRSIKSALISMAVAAAAVVSSAPASAQIVTIQQVSSGRFLDAWEIPSYDFRAVIWSEQNNDTQLWRMTKVDSQVYTFQQVSSERYLDAYENEAQDWNAVTRPDQNNTTQQWLVTDLGAGINRIQQVSSGRYLDAHENSENGWRAVTRTSQNNATQQWRITIISNEFVIVPGIFDPLIPPPPPPVHSSGAFDWSAPFAANLDSGTVGALGADLSYFAPDLINLQLIPINGAQISFTDGTERGYPGCSTAAYASGPVLLASIPVGGYVCLTTNDGRISEFRINSVGPILRILSVSYTTWQ